MSLKKPFNPKRSVPAPSVGVSLNGRVILSKKRGQGCEFQGKKVREAQDSGESMDSLPRSRAGGAQRPANSKPLHVGTHGARKATDTNVAEKAAGQRPLGAKHANGASRASQKVSTPGKISTSRIPAPPTETKKQNSKKPLVEALRSRIVGHENVSPNLIKAHVLNFRKHGEAQMKALRGSMDDMGWLKEILVSRRTNTIIDGHARWEEAKRRKLPFVPVTFVDLTKDEENKALALLDPITEMATRDDALFIKLLDSVKTENDNINETLAKMSKLKDMPEITAVQTTDEILEYRTDVYFPSSNKWGIPDLDPKMLYDGEAPRTTWPKKDDSGRPQFYVFGEGGFDERVTGKILTFYTEDWRFEKVWAESVESLKKIVPLHPAAFTAPDFSLYGDDPLVVQMWNIYRARWVARYWQKAGLRLIPSLATSTNQDCYDFAYAGLPKHPSLMSMQLRQGGIKSKQQHDSTHKEIAQLIERVAPERLVIYGVAAKSKLASTLPSGTKYIWCEDFAQAWFENGIAMKAQKKAANLMAMQQGAVK